MSLLLPTLIGSGLSLTGGLISNITNRKIADQNMQLQREINSQNIAFQREANAQNIAFQQRENDITRMREDNAIQRAAADMTAAGLSKTLAAGQPASAAALSAPSVIASQSGNVSNSFRYESALQKMNIAQLIQGMAVQQKELDMKDDLNKAEIENLNSKTSFQNFTNSIAADQYETEKALKQSQTWLNNSSRLLNQAKTRLEEIDGKYRADFLEAEIDKMISDKKYTDMGIRERAQNISESIARYNKLSAETKKIVEDIAYRKIEFKSLEHNINYAEKYNLPVGTTAGGLLGSSLTTGYSLGLRVKNSVKNAAKKVFDFFGGSNDEAALWDSINNS